MTPRYVPFAALGTTAALFVAATLLATGGCSGAGPCAGSPCAQGERCVADGGLPQCLAAGSSGGDAGVADAGFTPGVCAPACGGDTPTCDFATGRCVVCTARGGCDTLEKPSCDSSVSGGRCVGCLADADCRDGDVCDPTTQACGAPPDAGTPDGGSTGADGGLQGSCNASLQCDPPCGVDETCIAGVCKPHVACQTECDPGFHCDQGQCLLNGGGGPIQVTLRWSAPEDLDLHVVEPGGRCEIFYGNTNRADFPSPGCVGSLDLDSNPGCTIDNIDIENVIYPAGVTPPSGSYKVLVDYYASCPNAGPIPDPVPYQVVIRAHGVESGFCGQFLPSDADNGSAGSGVLITTFNYP